MKTSNNPRDDLSIEYLKECFTANFEEGYLVWNKRPPHHFPSGEKYWKIWNSKYSGTIAGNIYTRKSGYQSYQVGIQDISYLVHRVMWALYAGSWPENDIGHKDGNPLNNKISNLSDIPHALNMRFQKLKKQNKSGINGVYWSEKRGCWVMSITRREGIVKPYLTQSKDLFEIACARKSFELKNDFHEMHGQPLTHP
jgi:hypothetical protein